ncbi:hypothetical protein KJ657_04430 [Patescibacteria group bacterium]|nr:hypothetical protein [Patescibacteria group bacterium]MBU1016309.1 hypothetical protein [Patescibacteria group bacterium]MBU1685585.1 hypothetical protein [Patescibacteria group bacterium]MBU1938510.1 hypothetical protein [Patescibacteria group bacterium]
MSEKIRSTAEPQNIAQRISALSNRLTGHVSDEVLEEIVFLGELALAIIKRQEVLEAHFQLCFEQMNASQEARRRALAALLDDGRPLGIPTEAVAKAPKTMIID